MIRVADYIAARLVEGGVSHAFLVTGGGAMHLNDAFTRHPGLTPVCFHHEQACAMAAEGFSRVQREARAGQCHHRPRRHQRAQRRFWRLYRFRRHDRRLRAGQARDPDGELRSPAAPARRPGGRYRCDGSPDRQTCGLPAKSRGRALRGRKSLVAGSERPPRPGVDRCARGCAGGKGRPRFFARLCAWGGRCSFGRTGRAEGGGVARGGARVDRAAAGFRAPGVDAGNRRARVRRVRTLSARGRAARRSRRHRVQRA